MVNQQGHFPLELLSQAVQNAGLALEFAHPDRGERRRSCFAEHTMHDL